MPTKRRKRLNNIVLNSYITRDKGPNKYINIKIIDLRYDFTLQNHMHIRTLYNSISARPISLHHFFGTLNRNFNNHHFNFINLGLKAGIISTSLPSASMPASRGIISYKT